MLAVSRESPFPEAMMLEYNTCRVAGPDLNHSVGDQVTRSHIYHSCVKDKFYAILFFNQVFADILAADVARTLCYLEAENARVVASENNVFGGCIGVVCGGQMGGI